MSRPRREGAPSDNVLLEVLDRLVKVDGIVKAADRLGLTYRTASGCLESRHVSRRMRDALSKYLGEQAEQREEQADRAAAPAGRLLQPSGPCQTLAPYAPAVWERHSSAFGILPPPSGGRNSRPAPPSQGVAVPTGLKGAPRTASVTTWEADDNGNRTPHRPATQAASETATAAPGLVGQA